MVNVFACPLVVKYSVWNTGIGIDFYDICPDTIFMHLDCSIVE